MLTKTIKLTNQLFKMDFRIIDNIIDARLNSLSILIHNCHVTENIIRHALDIDTQNETNNRTTK